MQEISVFISVSLTIIDIVGYQLFEEAAVFWEVNGLGEAAWVSDLINNFANKLTSGMF